MITAKLKHLRISPRKVRLVADLIRGLDVMAAESQLKFLTKRSAAPVLKLLSSAIANALKNYGLAKENLYVSDIKVDSGPSLKRWRARAMGRAAAILKRTSHITITLKEKNLTTAMPTETGILKKKDETVSANLFDSKKVEIKKPTSEAVGRVEAEDKPLPKGKLFSPKKPYHKDSQSKKKFFSRQTFGNAKKIFRRKSI